MRLRTNKKTFICKKIEEDGFRYYSVFEVKKGHEFIDAGIVQILDGFFELKGDTRNSTFIVKLADLNHASI
jgi:pyridoxine/pyridoxamine 5'-phosphate oxidase